jgi:hypothetical protein
MKSFEGWFAEARRSKEFRAEYEEYVKGRRDAGEKYANPKNWAYEVFLVLEEEASVVRRSKNAARMRRVRAAMKRASSAIVKLRGGVRSARAAMDKLAKGAKKLKRKR